MKINIKKEILNLLDENEIKVNLEYFNIKNEFFLKINPQKETLNIKIKGKIEKDLKKLIPFILKGILYKKFLKKRGIIFKCFLLGIDSVVIPKESIRLEDILKSEERIPFEGLKKGIEAYLKLKKPEEVDFILINNLKGKILKDFSVCFIANLLKNFYLRSFEVENSEVYNHFILSFKSLNASIPLESFSILLENLAETIYVEKYKINKL